MKTFSVRDFFRRPRLIQELVGRGEKLAVERRKRVVFHVTPPPGKAQARRTRRSVGIWKRLGLKGDAALPLPPEETWR